MPATSGPHSLPPPTTGMPVCPSTTPVQSFVSVVHQPLPSSRHDHLPSSPSSPQSRPHPTRPTQPPTQAICCDCVAISSAAPRPSPRPPAFGGDRPVWWGQARLVGTGPFGGDRPVWWGQARLMGTGPFGGDSCLGSPACRVGNPGARLMGTGPFGGDRPVWWGQLSGLSGLQGGESRGESTGGFEKVPGFAGAQCRRFRGEAPDKPGTPEGCQRRPGRGGRSAVAAIPAGVGSHSRESFVAGRWQGTNPLPIAVVLVPSRLQPATGP